MASSGAGTCRNLTIVGWLPGNHCVRPGWPAGISPAGAPGDVSTPLQPRGHCGGCPALCWKRVRNTGLRLQLSRYFVFEPRALQPRSLQNTPVIDSHRYWWSCFPNGCHPPAEGCVSVPFRLSLRPQCDILNVSFLYCQTLIWDFCNSNLTPIGPVKPPSRCSLRQFLNSCHPLTIPCLLVCYFSLHTIFLG